MSALSLAQHKANLRRLEEFALNLELKPPERACARGAVSGVEVRLELVAKTQLVARACIPAPLPTGLQIESEAARGTPFVERFQDLQVGVKAFDERVHVRALNPAAAIRFLRQEEVLQRLPAFLTEHPQARLVGDELVLPLQPSLSDEQMQYAVKSLIELAATFGRAGAEEEERVRRNREEARQPLLAGAPPGTEAPPPPTHSYRPRTPSAEEQENGAAYVRSMRKKYRSIRSWTFALQISAFGLFAGTSILYGKRDSARMFAILGALALLGLSFLLSRCPSCSRSLVFGTKDMNMRACPHCGITLDPEA
jgi:hypothetical protein